MSVPTVSVVIPVYNCQQYIAEAVQSALGQTAHEVIVVDDGSIDDTKLVVEALSDPRLRYAWQPNQGVSAARNYGINLAQGELVAFLDADDYFLPHQLAEQAALFAADPELGLVQSGWQRVSESGGLLAAVEPWAMAGDLTIESFLKFKPVLPSALMVRRDWLITVQGFDLELQAAEDVDLVSRLLLAGCKAAWLKAVTVSYRQHANSAMTNGLVQARDLGRYLDKVFLRPDLPDAVRLLERSVRYHTMVWAAWALYESGYTEQMAQQLKAAWNYTPYLPAEALIHWMDSFESFSKSGERSLDPSALINSEDWKQLICWLLAQTHC
ncbi:MAG: Glycosyltransferases involved in cell wall biogenesis [Phormidesmis priestleyi Ana]|uniref:Glycosyltransferases involved in cell wall biogenesis n=1 Tax=Phormidesmis priestleyi Ana TaxID=1666911 RepID=A0A0N8KNB3_9CYAN|nr:MAG: Glycosyltransferases involved in cell wall biogenesis [Phormidesmis priestleyi Ana]